MLSTCHWLRSANASEILDGTQRDRLLTSAEPTYLTQGYLPHVCISLRARVCVYVRAFVLTRQSFGANRFFTYYLY